MESAQAVLYWCVNKTFNQFSKLMHDQTTRRNTKASGDYPGVKAFKEGCKDLERRIMIDMTT